MSAKMREPHPPRWLDNLVERFCAPHLLEQVMGDLHERYYLRVDRDGVAKANRMYWREVLAYLRPSILKRKTVFHSRPFAMAMLLNYFKIAFRNFLGNKVYSSINILGLSIGLSCSFFILLWVIDEKSYDNFHQNGGQIHQAWRHMTTGGQTYTMNSLPRGIADKMITEFPEVSEVTTTLLNQKFVVTNGDRNYREQGGFVSPAFFRIFNFQLIQGTPETVLKGLHTAVITERTARKIYGDEWGNVVGRGIVIDHGKEFTITGVVRDVPPNSSIQFDVLLPMDEFFARDERFGQWYFMAYVIYAKLREGTSLGTFNQKIADLFNRHADDDNHQIFVQPLEDVYLNSTYKDGKLIGGRIEYVNIFTAVAIFLLLIACFNFMNLATARSAQRAREIGVRKVIGAHRQSLIAQFITEAIVMAIIASLLALVLVITLLPVFNYLTGKNFTSDAINGTYLLSIFVIALMVGIISGSYPALYLSSFKPVAVLRGAFRQRSGSVLTFRKGLVIFQFGLSVLLIVSTVAVYLQLDYIRNKNLGLERENLLFVSREGALVEKYEEVAHELVMQPGISSVTASGQNPLKISNNTTSVGWPGKESDNKQLFYIINASYDFAKTMQMELVDGRDFSRAFAADSMSYLINEKSAELMGGDVVGKVISVYGQRGPIVGVVKNFSMNSLYSPIEPAVVRFHPGWAGYLYVRTKLGQTASAIQGLEAVCKKFNPAYPLEYTFLDQDFEKTYRSETVMGTLANIFAVIALFISCLGLFGLTSLTVEQRTKELGVRKVLGASVAGIVVMLSKDFLKLVLVGFVIACPITWYLTNQWLLNFTERITIGIGVFLLAGLAAVVIAVITVSWQSIRAAVANPVDCLRSE